MGESDGSQQQCCQVRGFMEHKSVCCWSHHYTMLYIAPLEVARRAE